MANRSNAFLDSLANSALNPKGNLADFQHAARLYTDSNHALAPKTKFLYHVFFDINPTAAGILPAITAQKINEMGMLVKSADLPKYQATVETKKKYNRVKNVQTAIVYDPVRITFHDDNTSLTTALMQAYYRYYFADGNQIRNNGRAYSRVPDSTYEGAPRNKDKFGLDNNNPGMPFFNNIQISQLSRGAYVTYTLVNPTITAWGHDRLDNQDGQGLMENFIEVAYEAVFYSAGNIEAGAQGEPTGFGQDHYDTTPSPLGSTGGGGTSLEGVIGGGSDLYDYIAGGDSFSNPLEAAIATTNLVNNFRNLSSEGLRQEGFNILNRAIGSVAGINVSGVAGTLFPKVNGNGQAQTLLANAGIALAAGAINNFSRNQQLRNNPAALESAARQEFGKDWQASGNAGGINERNSAWSNLSANDKTTYQRRALGES